MKTPEDIEKNLADVESHVGILLASHRADAKTRIGRIQAKKRRLLQVQNEVSQGWRSLTESLRKDWPYLSERQKNFLSEIQLYATTLKKYLELRPKLANSLYWLKLLGLRLIGDATEFRFSADELTKMAARHQALLEREAQVKIELSEQRLLAQNLDQQYAQYTAAASNREAAATMQVKLGNNPHEALTSPYMHGIEKYFRAATLPIRTAAENKAMQRFMKDLGEESSGIVGQWRDFFSRMFDSGASDYATSANANVPDIFSAMAPLDRDASTATFNPAPAHPKILKKGLEKPAQ